MTISDAVYMYILTLYILSVLSWFVLANKTLKYFFFKSELLDEEVRTLTIIVQVTLISVYSI